MSNVEPAQKTGKIRAQNRKKILDAAELAFVKDGFKGTSMQSIADASELPKANVLYYFKSKQALYQAVLEDIIERWDSVLEDMSEGDDPADVLGRYICSKVDLAIQFPKASKIFALEIIQGAPNLQDHLRSHLRVWVKDKSKIIQSWIDQGKMQSVDPEHLIFMIWSTTQHYADFDAQILTVTNKREFDDEDVQKIKDFLCKVILGGCGL